MNEYQINPQYKERRKMLVKHFLATSILDEAYKKVASLKVTYKLIKDDFSYQKRKSFFVKRIEKGERWNDKPFAKAIFHLTGEVPETNDKERLFLHFEAGAEATLFDKNGVPLQGFTLGEYSLANEKEFGILKCHYPLKDLIDNNKVDLYLEVNDNIYFRDKFPNAGIFQEASIEEVNLECLSLLYQVEVLLSYLTTFPEEDRYYDSILQGLEEIRDLFMYSWPERIEKSTRIANDLLSRTSNNNGMVYALGHSHLDLAWLWNFNESKNKAIRTMANAIYALENDPSFVYSISQPKQIEWIKEGSPALFEKLLKYEKEGRIELLGGEYVENDLNNAGEESLFRQMLYGQKFYLENFGHYADVGFYPDDFGFPPALPSILKKTNQHCFYTAKMRLNHQNAFPYASFVWKGLDGEEVLTHLSQNPYGYNGLAYPKEVYDTAKETSKKSSIKSSLYLYGAGDGGGGVSIDMLERLERMNHKLSLPNISMEKAHEFFLNLGAYQSSLPKYQGELYLENHQGTFTSEILSKKWNRYLEEKLKQVEFYLAENNIDSYDDKLNSIWKDYLLLQFHDVLSGTSIKEVYEYTHKEYERLNKELDNLMLQASNKNYSPTYKRSFYLRNFHQIALKHYEKKGNSYLVFTIPEFGETNSFKKYKGKNIPNKKELVTKNFKISFNDDGSFASVKELDSNYEYLNGEGNKFRVFQEPGDPRYANWNILENYRNQPETYMSLIKREMKRFGPLYEINDLYSYKNSKLKQTILIDDEERVIKIHHELDWKEDNALLKTVFHISNMPEEVISDTQFGYQSHSTKTDTSLQKAQYELCGYKWVDLSSSQGGVSLFNNARQGFYAKEGVLELSLLKSNSYPMEHLDLGHNEYEYALYFHNGSFESSDIDLKANSFNSPIFYFKEKEEPKNNIRISNKDIILSSFKNAYSHEGVILRLYNHSNVEQKCSITLPAAYSKATLCSGLEDQIEPINPNEIKFKPFEIKTILLYN